MEINATLSDRNVVYSAKLGDIINCSANGYPPPFVDWVDSGGEIKNAKSEKGWALLNLTEPGIQTWRCSATNIVSKPVIISEKYRFEGGIERKL